MSDFSKDFPRMTARDGEPFYEFLRAVGRGNKARVEKYLDQNPEFLNASDSGGWTALLKAVSFQEKEMVQFLLVKGADVNKAGTYGGITTDNALAYAEKWGFTDIAQILKQHGGIASPGSRNKASQASKNKPSQP